MNDITDKNIIDVSRLWRSKATRRYIRRNMICVNTRSERRSLMREQRKFLCRVHKEIKMKMKVSFITINKADQVTGIISILPLNSLVFQSPLTGKAGGTIKKTKAPW